MKLLVANRGEIAVRITHEAVETRLLRGESVEIQVAGEARIITTQPQREPVLS